MTRLADIAPRLALARDQHEAFQRLMQTTPPTMRQMAKSMAAMNRAALSANDAMRQLVAACEMAR